MIFAAMPIVVVGAVGAAMASPWHHHQQFGFGTAAARQGDSGFGQANAQATTQGFGGFGAANTQAATQPPPAAAAAAAVPNPNCSLIVPANPLTAQGLATPYQLFATDFRMGPCNEANINQSAFVQATIYDPATGALSVYDPLVVNFGTTPAAAPVVPVLPAGAVVGIWFGFDGTSLTLQDSNGSLGAGNCVNGLNTPNLSVFGQFAYCDAPAFFASVSAGIAAGKTTVPNPGTATDGLPCLTTRDFGLIDQDQSDNVTTQYLATGVQTAQKTTANTAALAGATTLSNPSDNALLDVFVDPALGCTPWTVPDLGNNNVPATSLGLDEIQANAFPAQPTALVPLNDPMTLVNANFNADKTNLYRAGVDQAALPAGENPAQYCVDMDGTQGARLQQDVNLTINQASPMPAQANSLFTFLAMRLQQSFTNLNCQNFGLTNPVTTLAMNGNIVVAAVFVQPVAALTAGAGNPAEVCVNEDSDQARIVCALQAVGVPVTGTNANASTGMTGTGVNSQFTGFPHW